MGWMLDGIFQSSVNRKECCFILWLKRKHCLLLLLFCGAEERVVQQLFFLFWKGMHCLHSWLKNEQVKKKKKTQHLFMTLSAAGCQIWVSLINIRLLKSLWFVLTFQENEEGFFIFYDLHWADLLCCFVPDLMNCDQRFFHCSYFCPFCKMQDQSSGQMRCSLML